MESELIIIAITITLALISKALQRKFIDKKKMRASQEEMKADHAKFKELMKEAEKNKKEIETLQTEMLRKQSELMNMNLKLSMFTLPIFLVAFWGLGELFRGQTLVSFIPLPTFNSFFLFNPASWIPTGLSYNTGYYKMYFFYYLISTIVLGIIEKIYDTMKAKKAAQTGRVNDEKNKVNAPVMEEKK